MMINVTSLAEALFVVFIPILVLSYWLYSFIVESLFDEDPLDRDSDFPLEQLWTFIIFIVAVFGAYISYGTVLNNGFWFHVGFIIGGVLTAQLPFIAFFIFMGIWASVSELTKKQKKKFTDTIQSYQVLIGLIVIALAIYFGRGF
jgi:hypothetical protein